MINLISKGEKLSIQLQKLGKKVLIESQSDSSNLVLQGMNQKSYCYVFFCLGNSTTFVKHDGIFWGTFGVHLGVDRSSLLFLAHS